MKRNNCAHQVLLLMNWCFRLNLSESSCFSYVKLIPFISHISPFPRLTPHIHAAVLAEYKYVSPKRSILERFCLLAFWKWVASCCPNWLAPNLITFTGMMCNVIATLIMAYYSPDFAGQTPVALLPVIVFLFWVYQTCDGMDGMQARRLGCGSAAGQIFDHTCDALSTSLIAAVIIESLHVGIHTSGAAFIIVSVQATFLASNLTLTHTGMQRFSDVDCQETQVGAQLFGLLTFFLGGQSFWTSDFFQIPMDVVPLPLNTLAIFFTGVAAPPTFDLRTAIIIVVIGKIYMESACATWYTIQYYATTKRPFNEKRGEGVSAFLGHCAYMFLWIITAMYAWYGAAQADSLNATTINEIRASLGINNTDTSMIDAVSVYPMLAWFFLITFGFGEIMSRILTQNVTQIPLPSVFESVPLTLNIIFGFFITCSSDYTVLGYSIPATHPYFPWAVVAVSSTSMIYFVVYSMTLICNALSINFFTVKLNKV